MTLMNLAAAKVAKRESQTILVVSSKHAWVKDVVCPWLKAHGIREQDVVVVSRGRQYEAYVEGDEKPRLLISDGFCFPEPRPHMYNPRLGSEWREPARLFHIYWYIALNRVAYAPKWCWKLRFLRKQAEWNRAK